MCRTRHCRRCERAFDVNHQMVMSLLDREYQARVALGQEAVA